MYNLINSVQSEIIRKMHKLCTIQESDHEQSEGIKLELNSSFTFENNDELKEVQVLNLLKLTGFTLHTIKIDLQRIIRHMDNIELNIRKISNNGIKIIEYVLKK
ncbi:Hypothetical_protein [Hexamita inflata]|uniref:Hypothetical_protein n=1 Tax=Hexamita inflata TaxID=28002 RepID=A0ABP1GJY9_9EUKA